MSNIDNARPGNQIKISADFDTTDPLPGDIELFYNIVEDLTVVDSGDISSVAISPTTDPLVSTDGTNSVVFTASAVGTTAFVDYVWSVSDPNRALSSTMANGAKFVINWDDRPNNSNAPITISVSASVAGDATTVSDSLSTNIQYTADAPVTLNMLEEGTTQAHLWPRTTDGDTLTLSNNDTDIQLQAMYGDDPFITGLVPMRFITQPNNDVTELDTVEVVVHPYGGVAKAQDSAEFESPEATMNSYTIYMSLNNGPWVEATEVTHQTPIKNNAGQTADRFNYKTFACSVPNSLSQQSSKGGYGFGEIRAVCVPAFGKPTILQQVRSVREKDGIPNLRWSVDAENRGVTVAEYTSASDLADYSSRLSLSANIKLDLTAEVGVDHEASDFFFEDVNWNELGETIPMVVGAKVHPSEGWNPAGSSANSDAVGCVWKNCDWRIADATYGDRNTTNRVQTRQSAARHVFVNCDFGMSYNDTYDPTTDPTNIYNADGSFTVSSATQDIIDEGFGVAVQAYFQDKQPRCFSYLFRDSSNSSNVFIGNYGCRVKYGQISSNECVDSYVAVPVYGNDIWGACALMVGSADFYGHASAYPFFPTGKSQISNNGGYNYDFVQAAEDFKPVGVNPDPAWELNTNSFINEVGSKSEMFGRKLDSIYTIYDEGTETYTGWHGSYGPTNNFYTDTANNGGYTFDGEGIWPVWVVGGAPNTSDDYRPLYPTGDHLGNTYSSWQWTEWGDGAYNPHHDSSQFGAGAPQWGNMIWCNYESIWQGNVNRQGVYWHKGLQTESGVIGCWNVRMSEEYQTGIRLYMQTGQNQHWGPGISGFSVRSEVEALPENQTGDRGVYVTGSVPNFPPNVHYYIDDSSYLPWDFDTAAGSETARSGMIENWETMGTNGGQYDPSDGTAVYEYSGPNLWLTTNVKFWDADQTEFNLWLLSVAGSQESNLSVEIDGITQVWDKNANQAVDISSLPDSAAKTAAVTWPGISYVYDHETSIATVSGGLDFRGQDTAYPDHRFLTAGEGQEALNNDPLDNDIALIWNYDGTYEDNVRRTVYVDRVSGGSFTQNPQDPPGDWTVKFSQAPTDPTDVSDIGQAADTPIVGTLVRSEELDYGLSQNGVQGAWWNMGTTQRFVTAFDSQSSYDAFFGEGGLYVTNSSGSTPIEWTIPFRLNGVEWTIVATTISQRSNFSARFNNITVSGGGNTLDALEAAWIACGANQIEILQPLP